MSKKELRSADARKSKKDPNQQQKSGAAKPTYVATDKKKKVSEAIKYYKGDDRDPTTGFPKGLKPDKRKPGEKPMTAPPYNLAKNEETEVDECWKTHKKVGMKKKGGKMVPDCRPKNEEVVVEADKKGKGSGSKDACYHKVKARFKVWPSAYGSGALVKCRKAGAANWGNSKKEEVEYTIEEKKKKNCGCGKDPCITYGKQEKVEEGAAWTKKSGKNPSGGLNEKGRKSYERDNPGSDLKAPQPEGGSRKKSFCARMKGMRKRQKPSNNTGKDRLSLSLKKWKCNEDKALDFVKKKIEKEVGKSGYVSKDNPRKPQTAAEKAKVRAHQAKVDKENAAERKKDPSQGRYPKG